ncbi:MAG TPA: SIMPL domain-containing protein [Sphingomicrobium sp.]|nr:SIMPL domain-containing protein [Sphingomicrobium sp.]
MKSAILALALGTTALPSAAAAQQSAISQTIGGTRLDVVASGEVSRIPNVAIVSAGVVSRSTNASGALQDSASKMQRVIAALKRAGVADADIQTSNVSLNPEYRYPENESPQLVAYSATNSVTVRFRNIATSGRILDALVAEGANQINGPTLTVDQPEAALDEARAKAIATGRARASLYARALGMRVVRVVSVNETDAGNILPPIPVMMQARAAPATKIEAGEQKLRVSVAMTFELQ